MTLSFAVAAALAAIVVAAWLARPLLGRGGGAAPRAAHDLQVFRDQLSGLDRDVETGVLSAAEAEGARAEIARRALAAAAEAERDSGAGPAPREFSSMMALALAALVLLGAGGLYFGLGEPGAPDMPLAGRMEEVRAAAAAARPGQDEAERIASVPAPPPTAETADDRELIERLREVLKERPGDERGQRLLAVSLARIGDFAGARRAYQALLDLLGDNADDEVMLSTAEAMIIAADGYVSPEAERLIARALTLDPTDPQARYYAGLTLAQTGRPGLALNMWRNLLADAAPDAPWREPLVERIADLEQRLGPALAARAGPGPDQEDIDAAAGMSAGDRMAMIEGMVARLEDRLASDGGGPEDWIKLIRAYGVLGRNDDAERILREAEQAFAGSPEALAPIRQAAAEAGVR